MNTSSGNLQPPPKLFLAPMEGVVDSITRDLLTSVGGIDICVTEFIRITNQLLPESVFYRFAPELKNQGHTTAGTPVFVQLLGSDPIALSENAARACELGAPGIDLNFGCPAKTVNRHDGGASLLKTPDRLFTIATKVRATVPPNIPVTAKIRLGIEEPTDSFENTKALASAHVSWITVHCRTKKQMYKPPADWTWIPKLQEGLSCPLIANGDIFSVEDFKKCQHETKSESFMIGRGALRNPWLFHEITNSISIASTNPNNNSSTTCSSQSNSNSHRHGHSTQDSPTFNWPEIQKLITSFFLKAQSEVNDRFAIARTKQWLSEIAKHPDPRPKELFQKIRTLHDKTKLLDLLNRE